MIKFPNNWDQIRVVPPANQVLGSNFGASGRMDVFGSLNQCSMTALDKSQYCIERLDELSSARQRLKGANGFNAEVLLQEWRLSRALRQTWENLGEVKPACESGQDMEEWRDTQRKLVLQVYFSTWRNFLDNRHAQDKKAEFYNRYSILDTFFGHWKTAWRRLKTLRKMEMEHLEHERLRQCSAQADRFFERNILRRYFRMWRSCVVLIGENLEHRRGYRRPNVRSRIDNYIENLQHSRQKDHPRVGNHNPRARGSYHNYTWRRNRSEPPLSKTLIATTARTMDLQIPSSSKGLPEEARKCFAFQWGLDPEAEFSDMNGDTTDIQSKLLPAITNPAEGFPPELVIENGNQLQDVKDRQIEHQRAVIQEQTDRLRDQQRRIYDLEILRQQLMSGHAITNKDLYQSMCKPLHNETEGRNGSDSSSRSWTPTSSVRRSRNGFNNGLEIVREEGELEPLGTTNEASLGLERHNLFQPQIAGAKKQASSMQTLHQTRAAERRQKYQELEMQKARDIQMDRERKKEEARQRRKMIKTREKQRTLALEQLHHDMKLAEEFQKRLSLNSYGLRPWKQLVADSKLNEFLAEKHFERTLLKRCLSDWQLLLGNSTAKKRVQADNFCRRILLTTYLNTWIKVWRASIAKRQSADDFRDWRLSSSSLRGWRSVSTRRQRFHTRAEKIALFHLKRVLLKRYFHKWRAMTQLRRGDYSKFLVSEVWKDEVDESDISLDGSEQLNGIDSEISDDEHSFR